MTGNTKEWFTGSKEGLRRIAKHRGLSYVLYELLQNAWDTEARNVHITFEPVPGRGRVWVSVEDDDPEGFHDLSHAWTLFAESTKKGNPTKRGRFNFGEKLVLAVCDEAEVTSTRGRVRFTSSGRSVQTQGTFRERGTLFRGLVQMTRDELSDVLHEALFLLPPEGVRTTLSVPGKDLLLEPRKPITSFSVSLKTVVMDAEGYLSEGVRKTQVDVYDRLPNQPGRVFEMGIPVGGEGEIWDIDVRQKVPLNIDRSGIPRAYLRTLRVHALNATSSTIAAESATSDAVQTVLGHPDINRETLDRVLTLQFGEKRAITDPSDREAEHRLKAEGYTIIHGRSLPSEVFDRIRELDVVKPAGQVSPSYKPYSNSPSAKPAVMIPREEWTQAMTQVSLYAHVLGDKLLRKNVLVSFEAQRGRDPWAANFGPHPGGGFELTFNYQRLGETFFRQGMTEKLNDILIHEFAHAFGGHLSAEFDEALSRLGAKMVTLALKEPSFFTFYQGST